MHELVGEDLKLCSENVFKPFISRPNKAETDLAIEEKNEYMMPEFLTVFKNESEDDDFLFL